MIDRVIEGLELALEALKKIQAKRTYTIEEMKAIRTNILDIVRLEIDSYLGHMPEKRHY